MNPKRVARQKRRRERRREEYKVRSAKARARKARVAEIAEALRPKSETSEYTDLHEWSAKIMNVDRATAKRRNFGFHYGMDFGGLGSVSPNVQNLPRILTNANVGDYAAKHIFGITDMQLYAKRDVELMEKLKDYCAADCAGLRYAFLTERPPSSVIQLEPNLLSSESGS